MSLAISSPRRTFRPGFTLMETVIAIGILAILLTAFLGIFGPAMKGIRSSMNVEEANRLTTALETELSTLGQSENNTGSTTDDPNSGKYLSAFNKAFYTIREGGGTDPDSVLFAYTYKGNPQSIRDDGTMEPYVTKGGTAGKEFVLQAAVRRRDDPEFINDLEAIDSRVFMIKVKQLVFNNGELVPGTAGKIVDPQNGADSATPDVYPEAVIAFNAEFYELPTVARAFVQPGGSLNVADYDGTRIKPIFTRNLGVRR